VARRALVAAIAAGLALAACGGDDDSSDEPTAKPPLVGVTSGALFDDHASLDGEVQLMEESGVTALRAPFYWHHIQPTEGGKPDFSETDPLVAAAARADIEVLPIVVRTPAWAARHPAEDNSPPKDPAQYADFLRLLIGRYGPDGSFWAENEDLPKRPLRAWQLWNEPDHLHYWSDQPYQRDYVELARAARDAIKEEDPGALVVMAGFADRSWESVASVYDAGAKGVFDVVAIHPYTFEVRNVLKIVEFVRQALRKAGDGDRPLWLTEITWSSGKRPGHEPRPFETTEPDQAARLGEALPLLIRERKRLGVERIFWENWISRHENFDNPFDYSGLRVLRDDGTVREKPAYDVFRRIALEQQDG
jgi:Cellulase (glycosyl hydrolase family 5)